MTTCLKMATTVGVEEWSDLIAPVHIFRKCLETRITLDIGEFFLNPIKHIHHVMTQVASKFKNKISNQTFLYKIYLFILTKSPWMSGSQHLAATYNPCTTRSSYTYSTTPLQQPMQSVSLINNSYSLPNTISGE